MRYRIKLIISGGYVSKVRRILIAGEVVVPTFQTSGLAGLQGNGNSRLLRGIGRRGQRISMVNSLKTEFYLLICRGLIAQQVTARCTIYFTQMQFLPAFGVFGGAESAQQLPNKVVRSNACNAVAQNDSPKAKKACVYGTSMHMGDSCGVVAAGCGLLDGCGACASAQPWT